MSRRRTEESISQEVAHFYGEMVRELVESSAANIHADYGVEIKSPIERVMYLAVMLSVEWYTFGENEFALPLVTSSENIDRADISDLPCPAVIAPQFPIGPYRADFVVKTENTRTAIECDGHEFHERTKQQAQRDKARDRYFQAEGWSVLRFTGSEIWADPVRCGAEAVKFIVNAEYKARAEARK